MSILDIAYHLHFLKELGISYEDVRKYLNRFIRTFTDDNAELLIEQSRYWE